MTEVKSETPGFAVPVCHFLWDFLWGKGHGSAVKASLGLKIRFTLKSNTCYADGLPEDKQQTVLENTVHNVGGSWLPKVTSFFFPSTSSVSFLTQATCLGKRQFSAPS